MTTAPQTITGTDGDDWMNHIEATGDLVLEGLAGNDGLRGGYGNDLLAGGDGDDDIYDRWPMGASNDTLLGGAGNDVLDGREGNDLVDGGAGDDQVYFAATLITGEAGPGVDTIEGGDGFDVLTVSWNGALMGFSANVETPAADGSFVFNVAGGDNATRAAGIELLVIRAYTGEGERVFVNYRDQDELPGGAMSLNVGMHHSSQGVITLAGDGQYQIILQANSDDAPDLEFGLSVDMPGEVNFAGGTGNDELNAGTGASRLEGLAGNDSLYGGAGADSLCGGIGNDIIEGGAGDDVMRGENDHDSPPYDAPSGNDDIHGEGGNDLIFGDNLWRADIELSYLAGGHDRIYGGTGHDTVHGQIGDDLISGGSGHDLLVGDGDNVAALLTLQGSDVLLGGAGNDTLLGNGRHDLLDGGTGDDVLKGGDGSDTLDGGRGRDTLTGGDGRDILYDSGRSDQLIGGAGSDGFHFTFGDARGIDDIHDFVAGLDEILLVPGSLPGIAAGMLDAGHFVAGNAALDADDFLIYDQASGSLYYDLDGNGAAAQVTFAILGNHAALTAADIVLV